MAAVEDAGMTGRMRTPGGRILAVFSGAVLMFLCLPIVIVVPMSFSSAKSLQFPPPGLSLRWYETLFSEEHWLDDGLNSILLALASSALALVLGTLAAYAIARGSFRGKQLIESNFIAPMILPPIITSIALYIFFAKTKLLGTFIGLIIAHTILATPYVILLMAVAIQSFDIRIEQVALTLGASKTQMLVRVVMPNLIPSALAAWIFAFIISFDEVIITQFLAGQYYTIPKRMFNDLINQVNPTITAVATLLIAVSLVTIGLIALLMRRAGLLTPRVR
jgi:ABC-type spermidine/putrescine transport system permease subunit II